MFRMIKSFQLYGYVIVIKETRLKINELIFYTGCGIVGGWLVHEIYKCLVEEQAEEISGLRRKLRQISVSSNDRFKKYDSKLHEVEKKLSQTDKFITTKKKAKIK
jgi:myo-inositol-1-phosphate synthase